MNRRAFLVATPALGMLGSLDVGAQHAHDASDPVIAQFIAEMQALLAATATPIARAEVARRAASQLRLQAAYLRTKKFDEGLRSALRGRSIDAAVDEILDPVRRKHEADELSKRFPAYRDEPASRAETRQTIQQLRDGSASLTQVMIDSAALLEREAPRMAGVVGSGRLRNIAQDCDMWARLINFYTIARDAACTFGILILTVAGGEICALAQTLLWMMQSAAWADGC